MTCILSKVPSLSSTTVAEAICAINKAVESDDSSATVTALKASSAGIRSITDECAQAYTEKLAAARQLKVDSGTCLCRLNRIVNTLGSRSGFCLGVE